MALGGTSCGCSRLARCRMGLAALRRNHGHSHATLREAFHTCDSPCRGRASPKAAARRGVFLVIRSLQAGTASVPEWAASPRPLHASPGPRISSHPIVSRKRKQRARRRRLESQPIEVRIAVLLRPHFCFIANPHLRACFSALVSPSTVQPHVCPSGSGWPGH